LNCQGFPAAISANTQILRGTSYSCDGVIPPTSLTWLGSSGCYCGLELLFGAQNSYFQWGHISLFQDSAACNYCWYSRGGTRSHCLCASCPRCFYSPAYLEFREIKLTVFALPPGWAWIAFSYPRGSLWGSLGCICLLLFALGP